jgi:catechol 2,3-dioxygenase-like lactoylglutathione lyase family enzyme
MRKVLAVLFVASFVGCTQRESAGPARSEQTGAVTADARPSGTFTGFHHVSMSVKDVDTSIAFYRDGLGCTLLPNGGERFGKEVSEGLGIPNVRIKNYKLRAPNSSVIIELIEYVSHPGRPMQRTVNDHQIAHICFTVKDLDAVYASMVDEGVKFLSKPVVVAQTGAKFNIAYDPDGNMIELVQLPVKK